METTKKLRITVGALEAFGACAGERNRFDAEFPRGIQINRRNLLRAAKADLQICWLIDDLKMKSRERVRAVIKQYGWMTDDNGERRKAIACALAEEFADSKNVHRRSLIMYTKDWKKGKK